MNTTPPTDCPAWAELISLAGRDLRIAALFAADPRRAERCVAQAAGLRLDYSRQRVDDAVLDRLERLAAERGFADWRAALLAGSPVNSTEGRPAWHSALRAGETAPVEVKETLGRMRALVASLAGARQVRRVVNLGIGGSDLGPRLVADALGVKRDFTVEVAFAANADPAELGRALEGADPAATLFVVVSKTFTTEETLANAAAARRWLGALAAPERFVAVTANAAAARAFGAGEVLPMWDWVGGRYSVWSAAGLAAMIAIGADAFDEFLAGAREIDAHFADAPLRRNLPVLMALLGVWNANFLGAATHAVLPYAHRLRLLPAYLQQLEMESNGKCVDREGRSVAYATAPVLWGGEGTPSQHSFHQLLHQGTQIVPVDFVTTAAPGADPQRHAMLLAHARAQAQALAFGRSEPTLPAHRQFAGNRPSSTLELARLDARHLGALLALWEHKVFTQGVLWNVNSFDQWGVELGKELAKHILSGRT